MVEAEKTAVIGAYAFPEFLWVAVGGKSQLGDKVEFLDGQWHSATGWSCYTSPGQTGGDELATCLYRAAEKYLVGRKIRTDYSDGDPDKEAGFFILNRTKCPAALVECGFMDNRDELEFLRSPEGRKEMVAVIVEGVINYING